MMEKPVGRVGDDDLSTFEVQRRDETGRRNRRAEDDAAVALVGGWGSLEIAYMHGTVSAQFGHVSLASINGVGVVIFRKPYRRRDDVTGNLVAGGPDDFSVEVYSASEWWRFESRSEAFVRSRSE